MVSLWKQNSNELLIYSMEVSIYIGFWTLKVKCTQYGNKFVDKLALKNAKAMTFSKSGGADTSSWLGPKNVDFFLGGLPIGEGWCPLERLVAVRHIDPNSRGPNCHVNWKPAVKWHESSTDFNWKPYYTYQQCACLTNLILCSTSHPKCHVTIFLNKTGCQLTSTISSKMSSQYQMPSSMCYFNYKRCFIKRLSITTFIILVGLCKLLTNFIIEVVVDCGGSGVFMFYHSARSVNWHVIFFLMVILDVKFQIVHVNWCACFKTEDGVWKFLRVKYQKLAKLHQKYASLPIGTLKT